MKTSDDKEDWSSVPAIGRKKLSEGEKRVLGGFLVEGPYNPEDILLIQVQIPLGIKRVAKAFGEDIELDLSLEEILEPSRYVDSVKGFMTKKDISDRWGAGFAGYVCYGDAVVVADDFVIVIEIKTKSQKIESLHDIYEGFGQVIFNRSRFKEDYPSVVEEKEIKALLLTELSELDVELIKKPFNQLKVGFFDPTRGGLLIKY